MNTQPCPFEKHCVFAEPTCSEELSATCDVIHNITPTRPKEWNPLEPVAVTLNREQWESITTCLTYLADWHHCRMIWWRECCDDRREGARQAKVYEASMLQAQNLRQIIEETLERETAE